MTQRKYLSASEVEAMINAVPKGTNYYRDRCLIMMCYFHGLRASELCHLKTTDIQGEHIFISRLKRGLSTTHPLQKCEQEAISQWLKSRKTWLNSDTQWLFLSQHGNPLSRQQFYELIKKYGIAAKLDIKAHPHMLRHACGFSLADAGKDTRLIQDYLGHRNIQHTVLYTATNSARFNSIEFKVS
ncbi:tyrosine-type recombinase/integrase [Budviciaceae bacterium BWR-B9]|uniref:Tyrosine-type recombinase/integrase n=1 Tax=Limnobaculum allomyrinae TaxID=2791986 RepID=A0ABS1INC8_9GAMM|nr:MULTISPECIES: tyrosine-type DNA invertase [Limnobaculum]MBK5143067.1 tyrosine-type recombinase/integrase [Limnobaculum allomyrinae]MBV7693397.1 tyrosine-type recombinase/integrase [Limnobaculum sp. M2-1]